MTVKTEDKKLLLKIVETKREEIVTFLSNLIGVRSYTGEEGAAQVMVREKFKAMGLDLDVFEADPEQIKRHLAYVPIEISDEIGYKGRPNIVGRMKARESAGPL